MEQKPVGEDEPHQFWDRKLWRAPRHIIRFAVFVCRRLRSLMTPTEWLVVTLIVLAGLYQFSKYGPSALR